MEKIKLMLRLYDQDVELFVKEQDAEIYKAAAECISKEMGNMVEQYRGIKSEHAVSMLTMLRFAVGYIRYSNMGLLGFIIWKLEKIFSIRYNSQILWLIRFFSISLHPNRKGCPLP